MGQEVDYCRHVVVAVAGDWCMKDGQGWVLLGSSQEVLQPVREHQRRHLTERSEDTSVEQETDSLDRTLLERYSS